MKAVLLYWHKEHLRQGYILEIEMYEINGSDRYPDEIKYRLILIDPKTQRKVLMDNHYPKGHHIHLNEMEAIYDFESIPKLIEDFNRLVYEHMEVKI